MFPVEVAWASPCPRWCPSSWLMVLPSSRGLTAAGMSQVPLRPVYIKPNASTPLTLTHG